MRKKLKLNSGNMMLLFLCLALTNQKKKNGNDKTEPLQKPCRHFYQSTIYFNTLVNPFMHIHSNFSHSGIISGQACIILACIVLVQFVVLICNYFVSLNPK